VPLINDPKVAGTWFIGLQHVWRTKDNGGDRAFLELHCNEFFGDFTVSCGDWEPLGGAAGDLTAGPASDKGTGYVVATERAPSDTKTLWAATRRGRVFVSKNADAATASSRYAHRHRRAAAAFRQRAAIDRRTAPRVHIVLRLQRLHADDAGPRSRSSSTRSAAPRPDRQGLATWRPADYWRAFDPDGRATLLAHRLRRADVARGAASPAASGLPLVAARGLTTTSTRVPPRRMHGRGSGG
jgi:hypothetical protein